MTEEKATRKRYSSGKPKLSPGRKPVKGGASLAKAKRIKEGLQPVKRVSATVAGHASHIASEAPLASPEARLMVARATAIDQSVKGPAIKIFKSQEQRLMDELKQSLIRSAPRAAAYLSDLVDGVHESAPHAVRAGAASKIIDSALELAANGSQNKELSEMTHEEIQAELRALTNALGSQSAEDAEIIDDPVPAAARAGRRALE